MCITDRLPQRAGRSWRSRRRAGKRTRRRSSRVAAQARQTGHCHHGGQVRLRVLDAPYLRVEAAANRSFPRRLPELGLGNGEEVAAGRLSGLPERDWQEIFLKFFNSERYVLQVLGTLLVEGKQAVVACFTG